MNKPTLAIVNIFVLAIAGIYLLFYCIPINKTGVWAIDNYTIELSDALATAPNPILAGYANSEKNKIVIRSGMSWVDIKSVCNHEMCHLLVASGTLVIPEDIVLEDNFSERYATIVTQNLEEEQFCLTIESTLNHPVCNDFMWGLI